MTDDRSLERAARSWIEAGPTRAPDRVVEAALQLIDTTPQERDQRLPRRITMPTIARVAAAAAIGVLLVGGALFLLGRPGQTNVGGPGPSSTPIASSRVTPSPSLLPAAGALEPGTYYRLMDVRDAAASISGDQPVGVARFTFTVPEGWATAEEGSFVYRESSQRPRNPYAVAEVLLTYWTVSHVYTDACHHQSTLVDAGTTTDELASLLVAQKGRVASAAADVTLGGFPAKRIELTVPADLDVTKCDGGFIRFWPSPGPDESGGLCCTDVGSTDVVYVVDVVGNRLAVVARHQASSSAEELAELEAIVASIMIEPPATSPSPSGASPSP
jgi:hypothetical protein